MSNGHAFDCRSKLLKQQPENGAALALSPAATKALYRMEGKEYVVKDGDVLLFKFNV